MFPSKIRRALAVIVLTILHLLRPTVAFIDVIARDFNALTRKVTAHHILLPKSDNVALALKQSIRNRVNPPKGSDKEPIYIVDAFSAAAEFTRETKRRQSEADCSGFLLLKDTVERRSSMRHAFRFHLAKFADRLNQIMVRSQYRLLEEFGESRKFSLESGHSGLFI